MEQVRQALKKLNVFARMSPNYPNTARRVRNRRLQEGVKATEERSVTHLGGESSTSRIGRGGARICN
jgi:hypothetical protein